MGFVIYLSSEINTNDSSNAYGYWEGKNYIVQGEMFPIALSHKDKSRAKVYKRRKMVENMADKLGNICPYIITWKVEEVNS